MKFVHINLAVSDPEGSANFYKTYVLPDADIVWLGDSLHLRDGQSDLAFQVGQPRLVPGAHHGFVAESSQSIDRLAQRLRSASLGGGVAVTLPPSSTRLC